MGARLGQHFLFDPSILSRIADAAALTARDTVLEIGPGKGTLTRFLAERAGGVTAIERDSKLAAELDLRFEGSNVTIVHADALAVAWPPTSVVCGNIPYQITSPLIEKALAAPRPRVIVFLMQREVADRLAATPGSKAYGALSVGVQLVARVERLFAVRAGSFRPPPKVESAVVRITPLRQPLVKDAAEESAVRGLVRAAFQRRRQQLQRTLRETFIRDPAVVAALLEAHGLSPAVRAEELSPEEFVTLARAIGDS